MKKLICLLLALLMLLACAPFALAAGSEAEQAADTLHALGLFRGRAEDENGDPIYDLDSTSTRAEALVMLIRLLGEEEAALASTAEHPFTDVAPWADRYVAYAYERGLTNGISATEFGMGMQATGQMYLTFVLRALGYTDWGETPDFTYAEAESYAEEKGLPAAERAEFLRADMAEISLAALSLPMNGGEETLIASLADSGAVDAEKAAELGFELASPEAPAEPEAPAAKYPPRSYGTEVDWSGSGEEVEIELTDVYWMRSEDILAAFPDATMTAHTHFDFQAWAIGDSLGISEELVLLEQAVSATLGYGNALSCHDLYSEDLIQYSWNTHTYIFDDDCNVLGVCEPVEEPGYSAVFLEKTFDASPIRDEMAVLISKHMANYADNEISVTMEMGDGVTTNPNAYVCEVYLNGVALKDLETEYLIWLHMCSENYCDDATGLNGEAARDSLVGRDIFEHLYRTSVQIRDDGTYYTVPDKPRTSVGAFPGNCYYFIVIDYVTGECVGSGAIKAP